ncbi:MAG: radical SAM protein [Planctomycetota bacterium]|nr:radical SAM protein [Planctomycetota bacterium]
MDTVEMALQDSPRHLPAVRRRFRIVCPAYPAFNIYSRAAKVMTALGPVCIATAVHDLDGWDVEVIDENNYVRGPLGADGLPDHEALQKSRPADVVGLYGGLTSTIPRLYELARKYRVMGAATLAGGQHFVPENIPDALDHAIDVVVVGEGEKTIAPLLIRLAAGESLADVAGLAYRQGGHLVFTAPHEPLSHFDDLPIPDFSVLRYARMKIYPVSGVRGCGMNCEFCTVKGHPRCATPERMMEQFAAVYERWGGRLFFIVDDLFGQNRLETLRLCRLLADYQARVRTRFSITVQIRLDRARDAQLLAAMRMAGVRVLAVGYESPIAEELAAMNKHLKPEEMIALTRLYLKAGFRVHGMFIFGYPSRPGQPFAMGAAERVGQFRRFIRRSGLDTVQVLLPVPLPGTELTERLRRQGRIYPTDCIGWEYYDGNFPLFEPDAPMSAEDMPAASQEIMGRFYRADRLFAVGLDILSFPVLAFQLHRLRSAWSQWTRRWWRSVYRSGGWLTLRQWVGRFKKSPFLAKLAQAKMHMPTP